MSKFKVGDLVVANSNCGAIVSGETYKVLRVYLDCGWRIEVGDKDIGEYIDGWGEENFDLAPKQEQQPEEASFSADDKVVFRDPRGFLFLGEYVRPHEANDTDDEMPGGMHYVRRLRKDVHVDLYCLRTKYIQKVTL